jgi:putative transcriptional regulator
VGLGLAEAALTMENRIRILRAERRMSQSDLAELIDVSRQTVHALENGKHDPSLPLAYAIARAFGVRVQEVFPDDGQPAAPVSTPR